MQNVIVVFLIFLIARFSSVLAYKSFFNLLHNEEDLIDSKQPYSIYLQNISNEYLEELFTYKINIFFLYSIKTTDFNSAIILRLEKTISLQPHFIYLMLSLDQESGKGCILQIDTYENLLNINQYSTSSSDDNRGTFEIKMSSKGDNLENIYNWLKVTNTKFDLFGNNSNTFAKNFFEYFSEDDLSIMNENIGIISNRI